MPIGWNMIANWVLLNQLSLMGKGGSIGQWEELRWPTPWPPIDSKFRSEAGAFAQLLACSCKPLQEGQAPGEGRVSCTSGTEALRVG